MAYFCNGIIYIGFIIANLLIILFFQSLAKYTKQINTYRQARKLSIDTNKKLLVIGDPLESSTNRLFGSYGYGDICIDMNLDLSAKTDSLMMKDKLENVLHTIKDNSVVIFESETLEYVDDQYIDYVISEMIRISGGDIFCVHQLRPNSFWTYCKSNGYKLFNRLLGKPMYMHKRLFKSYPPNGLFRYVS